MPTQIINIELPDAIYQRFQHAADATNRPLEEVVFQTISGKMILWLPAQIIITPIF